MKYIGRLSGFRLHAKMLLRTDISLNQFSGQVKEDLKQKIMQHDIIFKSQVKELHRIYWIQKYLMGEVCRKPRESQSRLVDSMYVGNVNLSEEFRGKLPEIENWRRGFEVRLPTEEYVSNYRKLPIVDVLVGPNQSNEFVGWERGTRRSFLSEGSGLYGREIIDLDAPVELNTCVKANVSPFGGFKAPMERRESMCCLGSNDSSGLVSTSKLQIGSAFLPTVNQLHADPSEKLREQMSTHSVAGLSAGLSESTSATYIEPPSSDSTQKHPPLSSKPMLIDLNVAQVDESLHSFNDSLLAYSSPSSSSSVIQRGLFCKDQGKRDPGEFSAALVPEAPHPALSISWGKHSNPLFHGCRDSQTSKASEIHRNQDHEIKAHGSYSISPEECCRNSEGFSSCSNVETPNNITGATLLSARLGKLVEDNGDLSSEKWNSKNSDSRRQVSIVTSSNDVEVKQSDREGSEEDTVSSHAIVQEEKEKPKGEPTNKAPTGSKSDHTTGSSESSSQGKSIGEKSGTTQVDVLAAVYLQEKTCNTEHQHDQGDAAAGAAEALVSISLGKSTSFVEQPDSTGTEEAETDEDSSKTPQYSSDSFVTMTLKLTETKSYESSMPTLPVEEENEAGNSASGVRKLRKRRGRAVRDFQKDILPGMVSLSRHEICEDLHNLGSELRRNSSRNACGGNWFVPVRSRRSRRGRRC